MQISPDSICAEWGHEGQASGPARRSTEAPLLPVPRTVLSSLPLLVCSVLTTTLHSRLAEETKAQGLSNSPEVTGLGNGKAGI